MGLTEQENKLFDEWRKLNPDLNLIPDGAADPDAYCSSDPKVIFLLKDANADKDAVWDLRDFLRDGKQSRTWDVITCWVMGIRNLTKDIPWVEVAGISQENHPEVLKSIVGINLKKTAGAGTTNEDDLYAHAQRDKDFLRRQIALYSADLIVCCGSNVTNIARGCLLPSSTGAWKSTTRGIEYYKDPALGCFLAYSHPTARVSSNLLFYGLMDAIREVMGIRI